MATVHIRMVYSGRYEVWFNYSALVVEIIKEIPKHERRYDSLAKVWTIFENRNLFAFVNRLESEGVALDDPENLVYSLPKPPPRSYSSGETLGQSRESDKVFSAIFEALPAPLRPRAYRALSRVLHPDIGGDETLMKLLNSTWEKFNR